MAGLMDLLAKSSSTGPKSTPGDPMLPAPDDQGFQDAAAQAMDSIKNNDVPGFAEALKACIEMSN